MDSLLYPDVGDDWAAFRAMFYLDEKVAVLWFDGTQEEFLLGVWKVGFWGVHDLCDFF